MRASRSVPDDILAALKAVAPRLGTIGRRVHWFEVATSTSDVAARLAETGADDGTVVVADAQSAGRGRLGRTWFSPPGAGLYVSIILRPDRNARALLTLAAGVAAADAVRASTGLPCDLKWPNDLLVRKRKLGGILAETAADDRQASFVILGIGINLRPAAYPRELGDRATSIEAELGRPADRAVVLAELLASLEARCGDLREGKFDAILSAWRDRAAGFRGAAVEWDTPSGLRRGRVDDIDDSGALLVKTEAGPERLVAGEVRWI